MTVALDSILNDQRFAAEPLGPARIRRSREEMLADQERARIAKDAVKGERAAAKAAADAAWKSASPAEKKRLQEEKMAATKALKDARAIAKAAADAAKAVKDPRDEIIRKWKLAVRAPGKAAVLAAVLREAIHGNALELALVDLRARAETALGFLRARGCKSEGFSFLGSLATAVRRVRALGASDFCSPQAEGYAFMNGQIFPKESRFHGHGGGSFVEERVIRKAPAIYGARREMIFSREELGRRITEIIMTNPDLLVAYNSAAEGTKEATDVARRAFTFAISSRKSTTPPPSDELNLGIPLAEGKLINALAQVRVLTGSALVPPPRVELVYVHAVHYIASSLINKVWNKKTKKKELQVNESVRERMRK